MSNSNDEIFDLPLTRRSALGALAGGAFALANPATTLAATLPVFPLRQRAGTQLLEDSAGTPFLIQGDTAWSLISQLRAADVVRYLNNRASRGFNATMVMLINHKYCTNAPANAAGIQPFLTPGDFSTPNPAYFNYAAWVIGQAASRGMAVVLAPAYLGFQGGDQGWYATMVANGPTKLAAYGRFLGQRFKNFKNIIWLNGGDYVPADKSLVQAVANGIRKSNPLAVQTAHCTLEISALEAWRGEPWLNLNTVYTHNATYIESLREYQQPEKMPFFLAEAYYENEHGATQLQMRAQAYQSLLSGAAGQFFGNNPIWHFDGPGTYNTPISWTSALSGPGSRHMTVLIALLNNVQWWRLKPDTSRQFLTSGLSSDLRRAVAAVADDGSFGLVYLPGVRPIGVNLQKLAGPNVAAQWIDPTNGTSLAVPESPFPAAGTKTVTPGRLNSNGSADWVLLLRSVT